MRILLLAAIALISILITSTVGWAEDTDQARFYVGGKLGAGFLLSDGPGGGAEWSSTIADIAAESFQGVVGLNLDEHWGAEVAVDYHQTGVW